jgi:hypothetical protein
VSVTRHKWSKPNAAAYAQPRRRLIPSREGRDGLLAPTRALLHSDLRVPGRQVSPEAGPPPREEGHERDASGERNEAVPGVRRLWSGCGGCV